MSDILFSPIRLNELELLIENSLRNVLSKQNPHSIAPPSVFITRQEAADILHITLPTLLSRTLEGKITGYRNGRRVLYKKSEVEAAMTEIPANQKRRV